MPGALGGDHGHVHTGGRDDLLKMNIESVGEHEHVPGGQVGGNVLLIDVGLNLVVNQDHDDIAPLGGLSHSLNLKTGLLGAGPVFGALPQTDAHVAAGVLQVHRVGVALGAVADNGDLLAVQIIDVAVLFIVHFCHSCIPP